VFKKYNPTGALSAFMPVLFGQQTDNPHRQTLDKGKKALYFPF